MVGKTLVVISMMLMFVQAMVLLMKIMICAIMDSIREREYVLAAIYGMLTGGAIMLVIGMGIICAGG